MIPIAASLAVMLVSQTGDGGRSAGMTTEEVFRRPALTCWVTTPKRWILDGNSVVLLVHRSRRPMGLREKDNPLPRGIPWSCFSTKGQDEEAELRDAIGRTTFFAVLIDDDIGQVRINRISGDRVLREPFGHHDRTAKTVKTADIARELTLLGIPAAVVPDVVKAATINDVE